MAHWLRPQNWAFLRYTTGPHGLGNYANSDGDHPVGAVEKSNWEAIGYYLVLAIIRTAIATVFDYFFIVKAFNPPDGYYKPDVYLYYAFTFALPLIIGWWKKSKSKRK